MKDIKPSLPLISVDWLAANLDQRDLVVLDASIQKPNSSEVNAFEGLRIKKARFFDLEKKFSNTTSSLPHTMPSPEVFTEEARQLGINRDSLIVVYDSWGIYSSPRAWWMFRSMGHVDVYVLDGGLPAWRGAGYELEPVCSELIERGDFTANYQPELFCDSSRVLQALTDENEQVIDARSEARFFGRVPEPRAGLRGGHMPYAVNLPFDQVQQDTKMLGKPELEEKFSKLADKNHRLIFSCGSGVTACVLALGAELAGYSNLTVYDGSWSEWGRPSDLPVVEE